MRVIIESDDEEHMVAQASIAYALIADGWLFHSKPGDIMGVRRNGDTYSIRHNVNSIRIYLARQP